MNQDTYPNPYPFLVPQQRIYAGSRACNVDLLCPIFPYAVSDDGTTLSMVDAPADSNLSGEPPSPNPIGNYKAFKTTLVGVSTQAMPGSTSCGPGSISYCTPLYSWTWNTTFKGTAHGGVSQTASILPIDPGSGTGGVTITGINGLPQTPPTVTCTATPNTLWPPNGEPVVVTVSGTVTAGTQAIIASAYAVKDEYGQVQPNGSVTLLAGGAYSFGVLLVAARNGDDRDGRTYTIVVGAKDAIGNVGSCSAVVTVPHDQGN